ncbi:MAG: HlyC/CorC family transporter [Blastocatellia bacterium]|jgi:magnesium and cobalt transporter|nr:HlyC/CorC family transporter [Blastocatellia bacterium]MBK6428074.1 HlyC/CorC family transporter [Blastocatellia bacterium]
MILGVDLALAGVAVILLVLLATIETSYVLMSDVSLAMLRGSARSEGPLAFFDRLMEDRERFHDTLLVGIYAISIGLAVLSVDVARRLAIPHSIATGFGAAFAAVVLCRMILPRLIAQNAPERVLLRLLPVFKPYYVVASIVVAPFSKIILSLRRPEPEASSDDSDFDDDQTMSDIQALIDVGEEEGILEEAEGQMIQSIIELSDTRVSEVMTPRPQIVAISHTASILEARDMMVAAKHSRLPVYDEHLDNIEGVIYVRDMLSAWSDGRESSPVTEIMRPAYFVPSVKAVADLLEEMRKSAVQIAIVIDEYGALCGVITIEDLLEEIVGEIEDEDVVADDDVDSQVDESGATVVKGSTEIRKLEVLFDRELETDDFTTVAGLVIKELGHLPSIGERMEYRGLEFEVLESDGRRISLVRARRLVQPEADASREATQQG